MMDSLNRPSASDTEEDLLRLQQELLTRKNNKKVECGKSKTSKNGFTMRNQRKKAGRFCLDLDALIEEREGTIELNIQERNTEFSNKIGRLNTDLTSTKCKDYAKEDGFPDVLDLSRYFTADINSIKKSQADKRSYFAIEFERLHGKIVVVDDSAHISSSAAAESVASYTDEEIERENLQRISKMSKEDIEKARQEIMERFDPKLLDFLRKRARKKTEENQKTKETESKLQLTEIPSGNINNEILNSVDGTKQEINDQIKQLEVFNIEAKSLISRGSSNTNTLSDPNLRLATDVVQMDIATKCLRTIIPRQQQNLVRMFDSLRIPPKDNNVDDVLLEKARSNLNAIKGLYLEQRKDNDGNITVQFADGIDLFGSGAWMLCPVRKVLDVIQKDRKTTTQDLVVVRLSLFWTLLVMMERPTLFYAFAAPNEVYIRLAEIFMMGPEVFKDDCVSQCIGRLLRDYLVPKARDGHLCLILKEPVAGIDVFQPFYEDLLQYYEEFSVGDDNFTLFILLPAYANQRLHDGLLMKCAIWTPNRNIVRQMTTKKDYEAFFLDFVMGNRPGALAVIEKEHFVQYSQLLGMYAGAIRNKTIMRDRNSLVYEIASRELKYFVQRHSSGNNPESDTETVKQFVDMVHFLRHYLIDFLDL